jgi:hypothetical protein
MMEALRSSETSVLEELRGVTSQKAAFFKIGSVLVYNVLDFLENIL